MAPNVSTWPPKAIDRDAACSDPALRILHNDSRKDHQIRICVSLLLRHLVDLKMRRLGALIWSDELQTEAELIFTYGF
jgi:hypothetical protein